MEKKLTNKELISILDKIKNQETIDRKLLNLAIETLKEIINYKRPQSKWIKQNNHHYCEKCNELAPEFYGKEELTNFCLVCGAEMIK